MLATSELLSTTNKWTKPVALNFRRLYNLYRCTFAAVAAAAALNLGHA